MFDVLSESNLNEFDRFMLEHPAEFWALHEEVAKRLVSVKSRTRLKDLVRDGEDLLFFNLAARNICKPDSMGVKNL